MSIKSILQNIAETVLAGLKTTATQLIIAAENSIEGTTGAEKRKTVVAQLDEYIKLPNILEWVDDIALGLLVDAICDRLNLLTDDDFSEVTEEEAAAVAASLDVDDATLADQLADCETVDEKLAVLLAKYGIKNAE